MSRTNRLLQLLQILRTHKSPVTAEILAQEMGVSQRTLYRDIQTLREQGVDIHGESGLGYLLQSDNALPPLKFTTEEINSIVLGLRWVSRHGDNALVQASAHVMAKIEAILSDELREKLLHNPLMVFSPVTMTDKEAEHLFLIRQAISKELKLVIIYQNGKQEISNRTIYPLAIGFMKEVRVLIAWCEVRQDFRHFRLDRMSKIHLLKEIFFPSRQFWLQRWHTEQDIPLP